jgi:acetolactate synthase-1/2/3 large subunit
VTLLRTAAAAGVEVCFANPGTTELPLVAGMDRVAEVRAVLGLFEGVCTGAADGYGRLSGKPAMTLLHLGPGLANGLANLHNARRAGSPVVNLVGEHPRWHGRYDPPLASDVPLLAASVSGWVRTSTSSTAVAADGAGPSTPPTTASAVVRVRTLRLVCTMQARHATVTRPGPRSPGPRRSRAARRR